MNSVKLECKSRKHSYIEMLNINKKIGQDYINLMQSGHAKSIIFS